MIAELLSLASAAANGYVLYSLYNRLGFPGMFSEFTGLVSLALFTASVAFIPLIRWAGQQEEYEELEPSEEVERIWRSIDTASPSPQPSTVQPAQSRHDGEDVLLGAVAQALRNARLAGDIGINITIPEHKVSFGGHEASIRGVMTFTTPEEDVKPTIAPASVKEPVKDRDDGGGRPARPPAPPSGNPVLDFIARKKAELLRGGGE